MSDADIRLIHQSALRILAEVGMESRNVRLLGVLAGFGLPVDLAELANLLASASRGRFGIQKAADIQELARQSVGIGFLADAIRIEMRCLLQQVDLLQRQVQQLDGQIASLMDQMPQHITSIPGVGPTTGAAILAEIGDVHRFPSVDKLVAYAGIDPSVYETGQFKASQAHMSKRGSPYLRHAL